ncbi:translation initiation factor IF-2-like [Budorcas taxicolor]|uniref:translation initiation factor IF-2-like n=1 Tax=Budorcas taxicolor TaxID=37181 RepID=UPI0022834A31|nr:translation initiation factor IF-2-like [Budorcas taxicolor]
MPLPEFTGDRTDVQRSCGVRLCTPPLSPRLQILQLRRSEDTVGPPRAGPLLPQGVQRPPAPETTAARTLEGPERGSPPQTPGAFRPRLPGRSPAVSSPHQVALLPDEQPLGREAGLKQQTRTSGLAALEAEASGAYARPQPWLGPVTQRCPQRDPGPGWAVRARPCPPVQSGTPPRSLTRSHPRARGYTPTPAKAPGALSPGLRSGRDTDRAPATWKTAGQSGRTAYGPAPACLDVSPKGAPARGNREAGAKMLASSQGGIDCALGKEDAKRRSERPVTQSGDLARRKQTPRRRAPPRDGRRVRPARRLAERAPADHHGAPRSLQTRGPPGGHGGSLHEWLQTRTLSAGPPEGPGKALLAVGTRKHSPSLLCTEGGASTPSPQPSPPRLSTGGCSGLLAAAVQTYTRSSR